MNIRKNKYILFVGAYVLIYFILVFIWWLVVNINLYNQYYASMSKFVSDNQEILKKKVFDTAFTKAFECGELENVTEKEICRKNVRVYTASVLDEEKLNNDYSAHPDDLMFVRHDHEDSLHMMSVTRDDYYVLGWDGKVSPISHQYISDHRPDSYLSMMLAFLTRNCKFFNIYDDSKYSCEVTKSIELNKDFNGYSTGYLVRLVSLEEETWLSLIIVLPIYILFMPLIDISVLQVIPAYYAIAIFLTLILPLVIAYLVMKKYSIQTNPKKTGKK